MIEKIGFAVWFVGLITSLISNIFKIRKSFKEEANLKTGILNNMTPQVFFEKLNEFSSDRKTYFFNVTRNICDSMVALNKLDLPRIVIRTNINPILVGLCGMMSSVISMYQILKLEKTEKDEEKEDKN